MLQDDEAAEVIATADSAIDKKYPAGFNRNYWHHFDPLGWLPFRRDARESWAEYYLELAVSTGDLRYLGYGLHGLQDKAMHDYIPWEGRPWVWPKPSWRDNPKTNPLGSEIAQSATRDYLQRYIVNRDSDHYDQG